VHLALRVFATTSADQVPHRDVEMQQVCRALAIATGWA
jgi:hypothetical protein